MSKDALDHASRALIARLTKEIDERSADASGTEKVGGVARTSVRVEELLRAVLDVARGLHPKLELPPPTRPAGVLQRAVGAAAKAGLPDDAFGRLCRDLGDPDGVMRAFLTERNRVVHHGDPTETTVDAMRRLRDRIRSFRTEEGWS